MLTLFAELPIAWMAVAVVLVLVGMYGTVAVGRAVRKNAEAQGESTSASYYLKATLIMVVGLGIFFTGLFLILSNR
jgi:hypothetical protein